MSVSSVSSVTVQPSIAASARVPAPKSGSASSSPTSSGSTSQETAAFNQALGKYKADLAQGQPASALKSLARQIAADAKVLGQNVPLPSAPLAAASAKPAASPEPASTGRLDTVA